MSSSFLLHQLLIVFLLFCLSKASGGTCLSYGHSCWGGHGKRNGGHMGPSSQKHTSGWYLSKLFDPPTVDPKNIEDIFKNQNLDSEELDNFRRSGYQLYPETDAERNIIRREKENSDTYSKYNEWDSENDESEEEIMVLTPDVKPVPVSKYRLYQIRNQDSNKPRSEY